MGLILFEILALVTLILSVTWAACGNQLILESGSSVPMKCHWHFIAIDYFSGIACCIAMGMFFLHSTEAKRFGGAVLLILSMGMLLFSVWGIGACANEAMSCHKMSAVINCIQLAAAADGCFLLCFAASDRKHIKRSFAP
ncbi:MAG: DUF4418 family protein [Ruminococcus sp.]